MLGVDNSVMLGPRPLSLDACKKKPNFEDLLQLKCLFQEFFGKCLNLYHQDCYQIQCRSFSLFHGTINNPLYLN